MGIRQQRAALILVLCGLVFVLVIMIVLARLNPRAAERFGFAFVGLLVEGAACISVLILFAMIKKKPSRGLSEAYPSSDSGVS